MEEYLKPTEFIESENSEIYSLSKDIVKGEESERLKAERLFYFVRDKITYRPLYFSYLPREEFKATATLKRGYGLCFMKAVLLISMLRSSKIPARCVLAEIRNYQLPDPVKKTLRTDLIIHGFAEVFLSEKWIKLNPAFDLEYCKKKDYMPTEFNGEEDALFYPVDNKGNKLIEYAQIFGSYPDLPYDFILDYIKKKYGKFDKAFFEEINKGETYYRGWS